MSWVKLHRTITEWEWYTDANTMRVWMHLLLSANYKPGRFRGEPIKAGQVAAGRISIARDLKLTEQQVRTSLEKLKKTKEITMVSTSLFSIITIVNWAQYQSDEVFAPGSATDDQPTNNQQSTTIEEGNNISSKEDIKKVTRAKTGVTRLDKDWSLPDDWKAWALEKTVLNEHTIIREGEIFGDYWKAAAGSKATKADWPATWRNWVRRKETDAKNSGNYRKAGVSNQAARAPAPDNGSGYGGRPSQTQQYASESERIIAERRARAAPDQGQSGRPGSIDAPIEPDLLAFEKIR